MRATAREKQTALLWAPTVPSRSAVDAPSAEVRLAAAVFDDALHCVARNIAAPAGPRWQELTEACDWIWNEGRDSLFSFDNVCDLLGLNPASVRWRLQKLVARQARRVDSLPPAGMATVVQLNDRKATSKHHRSRRRAAHPPSATAG